MNFLKSLNRGCLLQLAVVFFCFHEAANSSLGGTNIIDDEAIAKWKAYEIFSRSLQGVAQQTTTSESGRTERFRIAYKQNRDCVMSCFSQDKDLSEVCRFGNPRYASSIKRNKSDPNQVVLDKLTQNPQGAFPGLRGDHVSVFDVTIPEISPHFTFARMPLAKFMSDPSTTILKRSKESQKGQELVRFDYSYTHDDLASGSHSSAHGWIALDPSRCWCVRRSKLSSAKTRNGSPVLDSEYDVEFELIDHSSGFPLVKSKTSRGNLYPYKTKKRLLTQTRIDYEWEVKDSVPDAEFTLSAFGLPEPMGSEPPKPPRTWIWLIVAAIGLAMLAIFFAWLKRRHAPAVQVKA